MYIERNYVDMFISLTVQSSKLIRFTVTRRIADTLRRLRDILF